MTRLELGIFERRHLMTKLPLTDLSPVAAVPLKAVRVRARGLLVAAAALFALVLPAHARADAVTEWNLNASNALMVTGGQDPRLVVVHLAMVHGAVYDAVNAIDQRHEPYLISKRLATPFDSKEAAAATAAYRVLANIVPAQQPTLAALHAASLATIPDSSSKTRGVAVGEAAAAAMIAARTEDGRFGSFRFAAGLGAGQWRPVLPAFVNDPIAWLKDVEPFLIDDPADFRSRGPYPLRSRKYAGEFAQVKELGSATSTTRTADQTHGAQYWAENPPRTWNRIFQTLSAQEGLSLTENARFFAKLYLTVADALVVLASDHGDPRGGHRRESRHRGGPELVAADPDAAISRPPIRSRRAQRGGRRDPAGVLRDRPHRPHRHEPRRTDTELVALLAANRRGRLCPHVVRHPLSEPGPARPQDGPGHREVQPGPLLPACR
jgi:hypothetical protein